MKLQKSMSIAFCGLLAALMIVTMLLGNILPLTSVLCPAIAGFFLIPALRECGRGFAYLLYLAVSLLSLMLLPDKETALLFGLLLGLYPLCRSALNRISLAPLRLITKLLFCNLMFAASYSLLLFVFAPTLFAAEFSMYGTLTIIVLLLLGNLGFFLYDLCLGRISFLYEYKLRNRLFRSHQP